MRDDFTSARPRSAPLRPWFNRTAATDYIQSKSTFVCLIIATLMLGASLPSQDCSRLDEREDRITNATKFNDFANCVVRNWNTHGASPTEPDFWQCARRLYQQPEFDLHRIRAP